MFNRLCLCLAALFLASPAAAHSGDPSNGDLIGGVLHGFMVLDHMVPLAAIGLWAMFLGRPAIFVLPLCFPLFLAAGAAGNMLDLVPAMPDIAIWIATGAVAAGLLVTIGVEPPLWIALILVAAFGALLGYEHGAGLSLGDQNSVVWALGFAAACLGYQVAGALAGLLVTFFVNPMVVRFAGAAATAFAVYNLSLVM